MLGPCKYLVPCEHGNYLSRVVFSYKVEMPAVSSSARGEGPSASRFCFDINIRLLDRSNLSLFQGGTTHLR